MSRKKLKRIRLLEKTRALYECRIKCLTAVSFILDRDLPVEVLDPIWDQTHTCSNPSIREFLCESVPGLNDCCVCQNFETVMKQICKEVDNK